MPPSYFFTTSLAVLSLALLFPSFAAGAKKREAGFYTTRFGRSDPSMERARAAELEARWAPSMMGRHAQVPAWEVQEMQEEEEEEGEPIACVWSTRAKSYLCREPAPW